MLRQSINKIGLSFTANENGVDMPFEKWWETHDCIYYFPLAALVDNGHAQIIDKECIVPFENIYLIDDIDRTLLNIPDLYNKAMRVRGEGMMNASDFKYKLELLTHVPDGKMLTFERLGNIVTIGASKYLLNENQYELILLLEAFNKTDKNIKTTDYNLRIFAQVKELATKTGCELDSYLQNENVYTPEKIKIEIGHDEEGFTIDPSVNIEENRKFQQAFDKMRKVQGVYPVQRENGERVRVVLNPEQKSNLEHLKKTVGRHKTAEEIKDIIERPTEYFDPESFDFSELYSDRVIEIGIYKPKFYPFLSPYKSCWIPGATIETPQNGTANIVIRNRKELEILNSKIEEAISAKQPVVNYKEMMIDLNDAKFLSEMATRQLKQPTVPIEMDYEGKTIERKERRVLIIEENAENLGFSELEQDIKKNEKYTLFKNPYLRDEYPLKAHQEEGVAWLQYLYQSKASGCLMADDMGLGKTLQILYFIDWHSRQYANHKPYLIVAPISLLENWENEYAKFFSSPRLRVHRLTSKDIPRQFDRDSVEMMQRMDIILTNYESLRIAQLNFCAVEFDIVALDEAQKIKSPGTLVTNAAKALKSKFKIAMTGTPVENTFVDLWCIMDFCVPGLLGNAKEFAAKYQNPLKKEDVDIEALGNEIHDKLGIYMMRRLKKDAAKDLPQKEELKKQVLMPALQEKIYMKAMDMYTSGQQPNMLQTILDIREVSEHPYLYTNTLTEHEQEDIIENSARLIVTISFLDTIKSKDEKAIIFAERKDIQRMLQQVCLNRYGIVPKIINGDTPTIVRQKTSEKQSRQTTINKFQSKEGFNIIIMSPIAAGMGLNVTAANHVIHYSRHWNPAKENQATDRAYRIGQTKDVFVYYPMAVSDKFKSFDETLDALLNRKTSLATSTIFPTERIEVQKEELAKMLFG